MAKFKLEGKVTISVFTEIEAETLEEAIKISEDLEIVKNEWGQEYLKTENWVSDDFDGNVFDISISE